MESEEHRLISIGKKLFRFMWNNTTLYFVGAIGTVLIVALAYLSSKSDIYVLNANNCRLVRNLKYGPIDTGLINLIHPVASDESDETDESKISLSELTRIFQENAYDNPELLQLLQNMESSRFDNSDEENARDEYRWRRKSIAVILSDFSEIGCYGNMLIDGPEMKKYWRGRGVDDFCHKQESSFVPTRLVESDYAAVQSSLSDSSQLAKFRSMYKSDGKGYYKLVRDSISADERREIVQSLHKGRYVNRFVKLTLHVLWESFWLNGFFEKYSIVVVSFFFVFAAFLATAVIRTIIRVNVDRQVRRNRQVELDAELKKRIEESPEKIKPAWDMAKNTLEKYFERNLKQIDSIFVISLIAMLAGLLLIIVGIIVSIIDRNAGGAELIAVSSGVVTEFIGATFVFIYKSTVSQAKEYAASLERINSVGMSMQILDNINSENHMDDRTKIIEAKIEISKIMLNNRDASQNVPPEKNG